MKVKYERCKINIENYLNLEPEKTTGQLCKIVDAKRLEVLKYCPKCDSLCKGKEKEQQQFYGSAMYSFSRNHPQFGIEVYIEFTCPVCKLTWNDTHRGISWLTLKITHTPKEQIDPKIFPKIDNIKTKDILIRKFGGILKFLSYLDWKVIEKYNGYKLLEVNIPPKIKYLQMINPSTNEIHIEAVAFHCKNVKEALSWRNSGFYIEPDVIS